MQEFFVMNDETYFKLSRPSSDVNVTDYRDIERDNVSRSTGCLTLQIAFTPDETDTTITLTGKFVQALWRDNGVYRVLHSIIVEKDDKYHPLSYRFRADTMTLYHVKTGETKLKGCVHVSLCE